MFFQKPKAVLFDFGGTLIINGLPQTVTALDTLRRAAKNPEAATAEQLYERWNRVMQKITENNAPPSVVEVTLSQMLRNILAGAGLEYDLSMSECGILMDDAHFPDRRPAENIAILLDSLHSAGVRTAVISNTVMNAQEMGAAVQKHLPQNHFEWIMTSADYLFMKPDPDMFQIAARRLGLAPADCLYCGDSFENDVLGPLAIGMRALHYCPNEPDALLEKQTSGRPYLQINNWRILADLISANV